jgi:excisionase family DNA binding protein
MAAIKYYTADEACDVARCSKKTLYYWIHVGKLKVSKPGRRVLIREDVLLAFIEGAGGTR